MKNLPRPLKLAVISGGVAIFGIIFGWVMFPAILKHMLKKQMALSKKTDVREMWETIPFPFDFKIYFFNYTNVEEIQKGALPIVKEVGPYYFELWKKKVEIEDHEEDDTITYKKHDLFLFKPGLSGPGLTGEETIISPNLFILGTMISVSRDNPAMLGMIGKALKGIFDKPTDVFMRMKPLDFLFRGVMINCDRTEFAPKAICTAFKKSPVEGFVLEANNQIRFSLFGMRNNSVDKHVITVKRGIKNIMEVGSIVAIDGETEMKYWKDTCNQFDGTDATVFPPFLTAKDRMKSFSVEMCRPFRPWFQKKTSYKGIKANRYVVNVGDLANDPELNCFCDEPDKCPPKGIMDMMKCLHAPLYASLPHFLDCDPSIVNNIKGLSPNVDQHGMEIDFEPISGTPLVVKQRMQFNIELIKTDKYEIFKNLPDVIAPILWLDEGIALNKTFTNMLKHQLFYPKRAVSVIRWWLVSFGTIGAIVGAVFHFRDDIMRIATSGENKVTNVKPEEREREQKVIITSLRELSHVSTRLDYNARRDLDEEMIKSLDKYSSEDIEGSSVEAAASKTRQDGFGRRTEPARHSFLPSIVDCVD